MTNRRGKLNAGKGYAHYDGVDGSSITVINSPTPSKHPFKVIPTELKGNNLKFRLMQGTIFGLDNYNMDGAKSPEEGDLEFTYDNTAELIVEIPPKRLNDRKIGTFSIELKNEHALYIEIESKFVEEEERMVQTAKLKYKSSKEAATDWAKNPFKSINPFDPVVVGSRFPNSNSIGGFPSQMTISFGDPPTYITIEQSMRYVQNTTLWQGLAHYPIAYILKNVRTKQWVIEQKLKSDIDWPFGIGITTKSHDVAVQRFFADDVPPPFPDGCHPCSDNHNCCCCEGGGGGDCCNNCCDTGGGDCGGGGGGGGGGC